VERAKAIGFGGDQRALSFPDSQGNQIRYASLLASITPDFSERPPVKFKTETKKILGMPITLLCCQFVGVSWLLI
jgi:hypothetical protein